MGEVFAGRYELIDPIGHGGMGTVWRVWDHRAGSYVAAKVLRQSHSDSLLRFVREQGVRIHDPHVVTPLGWAGADDHVLFTMPLVRGGSVADVLREHGALPPAFAAELLRQLLSALRTVHEQGVVHRDVKPGNLLLEATGWARPFLRLTDFGVAAPVDEPRLTRPSVVLGTPGYLAPEQLRGHEPHPRQDLYAVGMVGFELLTGRRPQVEQVGDPVRPGAPPPGVPEALWDLLVRLTRLDPAERPQSADHALGWWQPHLLPPWDDRLPSPIELPDRLPPLPHGAAPQGPVPTAAHPHPEPGQDPSGATQPVAAPTAMQPAGPGWTAAEGAAPGRRRTPWRGLGAGLVALVAVAVALVLWQPWAGGPATGEGGHLPETAPPGNVQPGSACSFADVGVREGTPDGEVVLCTRQADGSYLWQEPQQQD